MIHKIDISCWLPSHDRNGVPVSPGDYVSCPAHNRTIRGTLEICQRSWCNMKDGRRIGRLVIRTDDGTLYNTTSMILKLKSQNQHRRNN